MFETIVVGVDGREADADALALAKRLGGPDAALNPVTIRGPVGEGLHAAARRLEADLIVVGSSHRSALGHVLAGNQARATLRDAPCPVAVAPHGYAHADAPIGAIGVGYDDRREARAALDLARGLAADTGARLEAMQVIGAASWPRPAALIEADVAAVSARVTRLGGVEGRGAVGVPVDGLGEFSEDVDLLVVGSRHRGPLGRAIFGSTSAQLADHARCPLLVVPRTAVRPPRLQRAAQPS